MPWELPNLASGSWDGANRTSRAELAGAGLACEAARMSVIASSELVVNAPLALAFSHFIDFGTWDLWAPKVFRPLSGPSRALRVGDSMRVAIGPAGLPVKLTVIRVRPNKEICWRGGVPGLIQGEHSFFFEAAGEKTRMRSEEPFSGLLARGPLSSFIEREAERGGALTLRGFAAHIAMRA